jgi:hypothetical protein
VPLKTHTASPRANVSTYALPMMLQAFEPRWYDPEYLMAP